MKILVVPEFICCCHLENCSLVMGKCFVKTHMPRRACFPYRKSLAELLCAWDTTVKETALPLRVRGN